jgi:hypothetical protein
MKKHFFLGLLLIGGLFYSASSQCIKPPPLTTEQVQKVSGKWKGSYTNNGTQVDLEINISAKAGNEVACEINNPPVAGKETMVEYFFCPSGEFHLRKYVGDVSFVFQGVPENGQIKGTVSMYDAKNKPTQLGNFTMSKAE